MKVECIANSGKALSLKQIAFVNSPNYEREYLEIGKIYNVYGITLSMHSLNYLIATGVAESPTFEPVAFFKIIENNIPPMWYFNYFGDKNEVPSDAVWGYKELVFDPRHCSDLEERKNEDAFKIFFKHKFEIDEWQAKQN